MIDMIGKKFGKLTVIKKTSATKNGSIVWECECACGKTRLATSRELNSGSVKSCGCLKAGRKLQEHTSSVFYQGTLSRNNTTGFNGISFIKGKYRASIGYKNKTYYLISDSDIEIAKSVRKEADEAVKNGTFEEWLQQFRNNNKTKSRR